jgi:hypothetical protein
MQVIRHQKKEMSIPISTSMTKHEGIDQTFCLCFFCKLNHASPLTTNRYEESFVLRPNPIWRFMPQPLTRQSFGIHAVFLYAFLIVCKVEMPALRHPRLQQAASEAWGQASLPFLVGFLQPRPFDASVSQNSYSILIRTFNCLQGRDACP